MESDDQVIKSYPQFESIKVLLANIILNEYVMRYSSTIFI